MFGIDTALIAAAIGAAGSAYGAHEVSSASAANAQAANINNAQLFQAANEFNQSEARHAWNFNAQQAQIARDAQSAQAERANQWSQESQGRAMEFNAGESQKNRDYQTMMSNTQYQRAVGDMRAAGLNPMLAYSQGGAGGASGSAASVGASPGAAGGSAQASGSAMGSASAPRTEVPTVQNVLGQSVNSALSAGQMVKQYELLDAQTDKVRSEIPLNKQAEISAEKRNQFLTQEIEERLTAAKRSNELSKVELVYRLEEQAEDLRMRMAKERMSQSQLTTELLKIEKQLDEAKIPGAKNEARFQEMVGTSPQFLNMFGDLIGSAGGISRIMQSRRSGSYSDTFYDRHGNESGGRSRTYAD